MFRAELYFVKLGNFKKLAAAYCALVCNNTGERNSDSHINVDRWVGIINYALNKVAYHFGINAAVTVNVTRFGKLNGNFKCTLKGVLYAIKLCKRGCFLKRLCFICKNRALGAVECKIVVVANVHAKADKDADYHALCGAENGNTVAKELLNLGNRKALADADLITIGYSESMISGFAVDQLRGYVRNYMDSVLKKEIYYKDDTYYYAENGNRIVLAYPSEEYLANAEAIAREKAEAGITTFFLSAQMLEQAVFTVGPDQSVSAVMEFDGNSQQKNIFYQINSIYNDDLAAMQSAELRKTTLTVTLDRFNHMTSYTLTVTAAIEASGVQALATYAIQYYLNYSETPREIDFPDDLESWGLSSVNA